jgi:hypothetical protein
LSGAAKMNTRGHGRVVFSRANHGHGAGKSKVQASESMETPAQRRMLESKLSCAHKHKKEKMETGRSIHG